MTFERSPQSFQHVEKTGTFYGVYITIFVENFPVRQKRRNLYFDGYEKDLPGEDNPADTESQQVMNSV